jgi:5-methyltetrahydropteroyltriglutamate--homocysteine methyltransferase
MQRSASRILTTHVGSLPRPDALVADLTVLDQGRLDEAVRAGLAGRVCDAVAETVARQTEVGIDVVSDGEMSKFGYATYVKERLSGFGGDGEPLALSEFADVPGFAPRVALELSAPACVGPVSYTGHDALAADLDNLTTALEATPATEAFMNAASPGIIRDYLFDRHYGSEQDYLAALADAMKEEYDAIVAAGFVLQLDCPDLAMGRHLAVTPIPVEDFRRRLALRVETINHALRDIPRDRVRIHLCWGNYESPHHHDVPLADILDVVLQIDAGAFLFEGANPRHEHEWQVFRDVALPDDTVIVPGVIDSLTNYVEHPDLVAQRIVRYALIVGPERVIAGTDCGFATFANYINVHPQITWRKLAALAEGAALASEHLRDTAAAATAVRAG